jgi:hypothetical protein
MDFEILARVIMWLESETGAKGGCYLEDIPEEFRDTMMSAVAQKYLWCLMQRNERIGRLSLYYMVDSKGMAWLGEYFLASAEGREPLATAPWYKPEEGSQA